jgi:hypothetical protein
VEPDFDLAVLAVEAGERVAVGDRDDLELLGQRGAGQGEEDEGGGEDEAGEGHGGQVHKKGFRRGVSESNAVVEGRALAGTLG